ncbi:MAG: ADP-glyceromanno-heptose 6-epimerase [bacterium]
MIILTGGAGFIGSCMLARLNENGVTDVLVVDKLAHSEKWKNLNHKIFSDYEDKNKFIKAVEEHKDFGKIEGILHLGACSSTVEKNVDYLIENNYRYSQILAKWAVEKSIPFIYASSGATYGNGSQGFSDDKETTLQLTPLNPYAFSKHLFDLWIVRNKLDKKVTGLKFFNVYGPNEYHKGEMASVVYKATQHVLIHGYINLFKSNDRNFPDGEQKRDFIYVKDCTKMMWWFWEHPQIVGLYNIGSGTARSWNDLVNIIFRCLNMKTDIRYIDMPENIKSCYQNYTEADMNKFFNTDSPVNFHTLEQGVKDYLLNYLLTENKYL